MCFVGDGILRGVVVGGGVWILMMLGRRIRGVWLVT